MFKDKYEQRFGCFIDELNIFEEKRTKSANSYKEWYLNIYLIKKYPWEVPKTIHKLLSPEHHHCMHYKTNFPISPYIRTIQGLKLPHVQCIRTKILLKT